MNALLLPFRSRFPLRSEIERHRPGAELAVPVSVLRELDALVERGVRDAEAARAWARRFPAIPGTGRGDAGIVHAAIAARAWVATADRELARRLVEHRITVLSPRDRSRLELRRGASVRSVARKGGSGRSERRRATSPRGKG